ncbi:dipeptidase [Acetobacter pasteurianus NBRC 101655]|uniref:dipeptidase n=1 Tax=Acetobacter pasteurianus TaxID=438 RepID=UPI000245816C|nr:dipeptidase [Acetobacter pasteurianus]BAU38114.1 dipeptidase [Acetobacter pasteurianus NBRC 101655]CCT60638.1 putative peptidase [Acetobacter pasteurianus 386B]
MITQPSSVSPDAVALHRALFTLDSHIDIPWPDRNDAFEDTADRRVDLPKMQQGGMSAGCFVAYIAQAAIDREGHTQAQQQCLAMLDAIGRMQGTHNGISARVCSTVADMRAAFEEGVLVVVPAVENGYGMGDDPALLKQFRAKGARYVTLTHNGHNALADAAIHRPSLGDAPQRHHGLSALGREAIAEMNRLGIVVDVSHSSKQTMLQAVQVSATPLVASHSCVRTLCDHPRNLDDEQLDALKESGGVIQITAMPAFLKPKPEEGKRQGFVADLVDHIDYVVRRSGPEYVGISSDFDGGGALEDWQNATQGVNITAELMRRGYDKSEIAAFWGENFLRVLEKAEQVAEQSRIA